jgi:hypothetical protein
VSTRRALRRSIEEFNNTLGPTATAVAGTLTQLGVRGCPKDSTQCALARYLWVIVGSERSVINITVTDRSVHVRRSPGHLPLIVGLPKPVRTFIRAFDGGCYPELLAIDGAHRPGTGPGSPLLPSGAGEKTDVPAE